MIFFTDENISFRAAYMLDQFYDEHAVWAFLDHFKAGTPDPEWLAKVASWEEVPVVIAGDGRILKNKVERQVLKGSGLRFVYLAPGWTNLVWPAFAWRIVKVWPDIVRKVEQARYPMVFEVAIGGKVTVLGRTSEF